MNVSLYGRPSRWAMTEYGARHLARTPDRLAIKNSSLDWDGETLTAHIDEVTAPCASVFKDNCPLWTYILAEAIQNKQPPEPPPTTEKTPVSTPQLGPVGGRIVAEVFLGLMYADEFSILSECPDWTPPGNANYELKDFVKFALGL